MKDRNTNPFFRRIMGDILLVPVALPAADVILIMSARIKTVVPGRGFLRF